MSRLHLLGLLALSLIWGSTWAAIRVVVQHMPPMRSVSLRFFLASSVLLPLIWFSRSRLPRGREWAMLSLLSVITIVVPFSLTAWAEGRISSSATSILFATGPLFTAWMEPRVGRQAYRRHVPRPVLFAMLLGLAGTLLVVSGSISRSSAQTAGAATVLFVVVLGAVTGTAAREQIRALPVPTVAGVQCVIAAGILGVSSLVIESERPTDWTGSSIFAMLFLGIFSSAIGFLLFYWLMAELRPYQLASRQLIMPLVAVVEGVLLLHEPMPWTMVAGSGIVLISLIWLFRTTATIEETPLGEVYSR